MGPYIYLPSFKACLDIHKYAGCQYYFPRRFRDLFFAFLGTGFSVTSCSVAMLSIRLAIAAEFSDRELNLSLIPKRIRNTFSSRGVSVDNIFFVCSARSMFIVASDGDIIFLSSIKSPK